MVWSVYEKPDGEEVKVWHITDANDIPGGNVASPGQVLVREMREDPDAPGQMYEAEYFLDTVRPDWVLLSELPETVPPNEPIPPAEDPRADLWRLSEDAIKFRAAQLGVSPPEGEEWIKRDWVYAVHDARIAAEARLAAEASSVSEDTGSDSEPSSVEGDTGSESDPVPTEAEEIAGKNVDDALEAVGDDAELAAAVKAAEEAKGDDARVTLLQGLDKIIKEATAGEQTEELAPGPDVNG